MWKPLDRNRGSGTHPELPCVIRGCASAPVGPHDDRVWVVSQDISEHLPSLIIQLMMDGDRDVIPGSEGQDASEQVSIGADVPWRCTKSWRTVVTEDDLSEPVVSPRFKFPFNLL